jgi:hypothetical protein
MNLARLQSRIGDRHLHRWIFLGGLCLNLAIVLRHGVMVAGDTPRYLDGARNLVEGLPLVGKQPAFKGYIALVALFHWLGLGDAGLVGFQAGISLLAGLCLRSAVLRISGSRAAGNIAMACFVLNPDFARFNAYVLTESVFFAMVICVAGLLTRMAQEDDWGLWAAAALAASLYAASVRPHGWVVFLVSAAALIVRQPGVRSSLILGSVTLCALALRVLPVWPRGGRAEGLVTSLEEGWIIWNYSKWVLPVPGAAQVQNLSSALSYLVANSGSLLELAISRIGIELLHVRPFYSLTHNFAAAAFVLSAYALAAVGVWGQPRSLIRWIWLAIFAGQCLVVAISYSDWDGRFLLHVLPLVIGFAAMGVVRLLGIRDRTE